MGGCDRHLSDSFWTFFFFYLPFLSLDARCHHAVCCAALAARNLPDEGPLQPWFFDSSQLSGSLREVCRTVTLKGPSNHCSFHEHHSSTASHASPVLHRKSRWLVCGGNERYWEEIPWKINYFIPKQKRCHNFREEIPGQAYRCYSHLESRSQLWNFNYMSPLNNKCFLDCFWFFFLPTSDFCYQLKPMLWLYLWDQIS